MLANWGAFHRLGACGRYEIIAGNLADLARLPVLQNPPAPHASPGPATGQGRRKGTLWLHCMEQAHHCDDFDALPDVARTSNAGFAPPLAEAEVLKTATSAWGYTARGENRIGRSACVVTTHDEIDGLMQLNPDAYLLLLYLRRRHSGREFVLANAMAPLMPGDGWTEKRLARARRDLEASGKIELLRAAGKYRGPPLYRLRVDKFDHQ